MGKLPELQVIDDPKFQGMVETDSTNVAIDSCIPKIFFPCMARIIGDTINIDK